MRLRTRGSAILTGIDTVLADDPSLNVRLPEAKRQPLRVILDSGLRTPLTARTLRLPGSVLIFTAVADPAAQEPLRAAGADIVVVPRTERGLNLRAVMAELAHRECNEVHVECGPTLAGALLQAGLVDELVIYMAPLLLGDRARGLFQLPELTRMSGRRELEDSGNKGGRNRLADNHTIIKNLTRTLRKNLAEAAQEIAISLANALARQ